MNKQQKQMKEVREWLRENAPQVKTFLVDTQFTGSITCNERRDMGKKGYKVVSHEFKDFDELKAFYGKRENKKRAKATSPKPRASRSVARRARDVVKRVVAGARKGEK